MAKSTCVKCGNSSFELRPASIRGVEDKLLFIQCDACGGVINTVEKSNITGFLLQIAKHMGLTLKR